MEENKNKPVMLAIVGKNMRDLVSKSNKEGVQKEEIVSIQKDGDQFVLTYYK